VSRLNQVRRELTDRLDEALKQRLRERITAVQAQVLPEKRRQDPSTSKKGPDTFFRWSIKVDRAEFLDAFSAADLTDVDEVILDIARDSWPVLKLKVLELAARISADRIRFALPALTRRWEDGALRFKIEQLRLAGWRKWEAANLSAWSYLGLGPAANSNPEID